MRAHRQAAFHSWALWVGLAAGVAGVGCRGKAPKPVATETAPEAAPDVVEAAPSTPAAPPVVTPKTVDELGQRIVEALVAKDVARMAAYVPSPDFIDRHCPEQADTMRSAYTDKLRESTSDAKVRSEECASIDWTGATLARATLKKNDGVPFYGCAPISDGSVEVRVQVGKDERVVSVPRIFMVGDAVYLGAMPRCAVATPCPEIVKHLETLVAAAGGAPEAAPLTDEKRASMVSFCDSYWNDPAQREHLACMRGATSYAGIASCGVTLSSMFVSWPSK
ncbi:MAG: hypothetical protein U1F43_02710 [Myxococcota bacterium]